MDWEARWCHRASAARHAAREESGTSPRCSRPRPGRDVVENIEATFRILRALHDGPQTLDDTNAPPNPLTGLPSLRVIFAGRRPLASSGPGWSAESELPPQPFLRLLPLHGFSRGEAVDYLTTRRHVPSGLVEPILGRVP